MFGTTATKKNICNNWVLTQVFQFRFVLVSIFLIVNSTVACGDKPIDSSAANKNELRKIMQGVNFVPQIGKGDAFCKAFYSDFKDQKNIEYIDPIVKANKYDDLALKPYQDKCPKLQMNRTMTFSASDIELGGEPTSEADAESRATSILYGIGNFQLYQVDIDNHPENGKELIFYYEGEWDKKHDKTYPAPRVYRTVDFERCETGLFVAFNQRGSAIWTRNEVLQWKGTNGIFILQSWRDNPEYISLTLRVYSDRFKRLATRCNYYKGSTKN
jgi:hypothetical protein